jgi:hypothetical protein
MPILSHIFQANVSLTQSNSFSLIICINNGNKVIIESVEIRTP